jgi:putative iron-dependent peroxidase
MPFGRPGHGEFGTYFIGYSRSPRPIEQMLENMFVGRPPGNYDRLLDFSRAVTGNLFFVPSATFLENVTENQTTEDEPVVAEPAASPAAAPTPSVPPVRDGSLGIGSLKGDIPHE